MLQDLSDMAGRVMVAYKQMLLEVFDGTLPLVPAAVSCSQVHVHVYAHG